MQLLHKAPNKTAAPISEALDETTSVPPVAIATARFAGAQVEYLSSALQGEADTFAAALATLVIISQPSPPVDTHPEPSASATIPQPPPNPND